MEEEKREARRKLLAELEGTWTPSTGTVGTDVTGEPVQAPTAEMQAALDAAAERLVESLEPPPSVPSMAELDSGWGEDEDDDADEEPDAGLETELPDEKLDPLAYAAARKAREERSEARRERKRSRADGNKARRKARVDAARAKQKGKTRKARPAAAAQAATIPKAIRRAAKRERAEARGANAGVSVAGGAEGDAASASIESHLLARVGRVGRSSNSRMLALALVIFVAAAIFAAVVAR